MSDLNRPKNDSQPKSTAIDLSRSRTDGILSPAACGPIVKSIVQPQSRISMRSYVKNLGITLALTSTVFASYGQEAARISMASEQAAEQQARTSDLSYYNMQYGPLHARLQADVGMETTDNVNYSKTNREADISFRPGVNFRALWPVTDLNKLYLSLGAGYIKHVNETSLDSPYISPDSGLAFKMYVSDFVFDFHNRFNLTQNGGQIPTIGGTGKVGKMENTTGVSGDWDLNQLIVSAGYDHDLMRATDSLFEYGDRDSELFFSRASFLLNSSTRAGLEAGGGLTDYQDDILNNNSHVNVGPFANAQIGEHFKATLSGGYVAYFLDSEPRTGSSLYYWRLRNQSTIDAIYGNVGLNHRVNTWMEHSLLGTHRLENGFNVTLMDLYRVEYRDVFTFLKDTTLMTSFAYEHVKSYASVDEIIDRFIVSASVNHQFSPRVSGGLLYQFTSRDTNFKWRDYYQNRLALNMKYSF